MRAERTAGAVLIRRTIVVVGGPIGTRVLLPLPDSGGFRRASATLFVSSSLDCCEVGKEKPEPGSLLAAAAARETARDVKGLGLPLRPLVRSALRRRGERRWRNRSWISWWNLRAMAMMETVAGPENLRLAVAAGLNRRRG